MKIPNIKIKYNPYLDRIFSEWVASKSEYKAWVRPADAKIKDRTGSFNGIWEEKGAKILAKICEKTGLHFKRNHFTIHIVSANPRSYSDPIVISVSRNADEFFETAIHELIHCLFVDNARSLFVKRSDKLPDHVALYAVMESAMRGTVNKRTRDPKHNGVYRTAKSIVKQKGYKDIIEGLKA